VTTTSNQPEKNRTCGGCFGTDWEIFSDYWFRLWSRGAPCEKGARVCGFRTFRNSRQPHNL